MLRRIAADPDDLAGHQHHLQTEEIVGGGTEAGLTAAEVVDGDLLRRYFTTLEEKDVPRWDGLHYLAVVHPRVIHDLRSEAGPNNWRTPKDYTNDGLLSLGGEMGEYEGFRFLSNNRVIKGAGTGVATYNSYFVGRQALAEAEWMPLQTVIGPQIDNLRRFYTLGWKIDADWAVYQPDAIKVAISSSSLG
jgi:N4-gp56 family major capsid protein